MRNLEKILAVLAIVTISVSLVRHVYVRWFESRTSVMDRFEPPLKNEIAQAQSLEELIKRYEPLRKEVDQLKKQHEDLDSRQRWELENDAEPFKSEGLLKAAIDDWENKSNEVFKIRFYWLAGLMISLLGWALHAKGNRLFGLSVLIVGFSEISYWISPSYFGGTREFDRLLNNEILLSAIALAFLIVVIHFSRIFAEDNRNST